MVSRSEKSTLIAYLLWFFSFTLLLHRIYLRRYVGVLIMWGFLVILAFIGTRIMQAGVDLGTQIIESPEAPAPDRHMARELVSIVEDARSTDQETKDALGALIEIAERNGIGVPEFQTSTRVVPFLAGTCLLWWLIDAFLIPGMVRRCNEGG